VSGLALSAAVSLAACGAGGSAPITTSPTVGTTAGASASATFSIQIPAKAVTSQGRRRTQYVSASTQSIAISTNGAAPAVANLTPTSPGCVAATAPAALTCTLAAPAVIGADTFTLTLYDSVGATGNILSVATVHQTIGGGHSNSIHVTLNPVVSALQLTIATPKPPVGTAATIALNVSAFDADGNIIIAPGTYVNANNVAVPIVLSDSDTSKITKLSATKLTSPSAAQPTLVYTGASLPGGATITALAAGVPSVTAVFAPQSATHLTGTLASGATYVADVPANWNGELILYSHGYVNPGAPNPALDAPDNYLGNWWLAHGYALAGSSYATTGYAVSDALSDQMTLLDLLPSLGVTPARVIAMGDSMGGLITAALIEANPTSFAGALPMCGNLAGTAAEWNGLGDFGFAFATLLGGSATLDLVNISSPATNIATAQTILNTAVTTPSGEARLALAAALGSMPDWYGGASPPASTQVNTLGQQLTDWANFDLWFEFDGRAEFEARAGGDPYDNTTVDYAANFAVSPIASEVNALYQNAGLDINADLAALNSANRITGNTAALSYAAQYAMPSGTITIPVLTLHTIADGLVPVNEENTYAATVAGQGNSTLLQQVFVQRAGHCAFTDAEQIAAFLTLDGRIATGAWSSTTAAAMSALAATYGSSAFIDFTPPPYLSARSARFKRSPAVPQRRRSP
jgi:pimeloyl-ACP methyl ester carboxylesterase